MPAIKSQLILLKEDHQFMISYLNAFRGTSVLDRRNAQDLMTELKKAKLVEKGEFPADVVRLNSMVKIQTDKQKVIELRIVPPDQADIREKKISIMAPIGTALIGFRKGQKVKWQVPAGTKTFSIMDVVNEP